MNTTTLSSVGTRSDADAKISRRKRFSLGTLATSLVLTCLAPGATFAQDTDFPNRPLRLIVPLSPGGNVDIVARLLAKGMSEELGQQVVVENRPGASSVVGTQAVATAPADGYTILAMGNTFVSAAALIPNIGYDPIKDFTGLSQTVSLPMVLVVNPQVPASSVSDVISLIKTKPDSATNGTAGAGSTSHFAGELFASQAGVQIMHVPYKGNAQALTDVMGGQITMMFDSLGSSAGAIKAGRVKPIGLTTKTRSKAFPDIPTISESGLPDYEDVTFNGLVLPSGTPAPVVNRLFDAVHKVMSEPQIAASLAERGIDVTLSTSPTEFTDYLKSESEKYSKLVKSRGMKIQ